MAGLRKDVELIFRGEDRASPTIKKVRDNVAGLSDAIQNQIAAAGRGEGSIDELAKAYRALKDAQGDVGEIAKLATAYENINAKLTEQAKKVEEARAKQARANAEYEAAETKTKRLTAAREAAERQLNGALAKEQQLQTEVRQLGAALDAAGGDSKSFAATQEAVRQAAIETARAIRDAAAAMDQFKGKQAGGQANIRAAEELRSFNAMAAGSGLPQAQINFISTLENRMEALNAAIREDQASMAALNREFGDRAAADAAQRVRAMAVALDEADAAAERLKATQGFRQMASEIEAGARDISRFGAQADTAAASAQRFSDTIQGILNPAQAAAASIDGINAILVQAEGVTEGAKRRVSEYNAELNNLQSASAGIQSIARLTDQFQRQETATAAARAEMDRAQAEVLQLAAAMKSSAAPTQEMASELQRAETNLENAGRAFQSEAAKLAVLDAKLKATGVDTRNLAAAQDQLAGAARRVAAAQATVAAKTGGTGAFLGLRPHEIQNLGFQVNDIIVSIASGQAPMRVFLQQGAQIGQIIPGAFAKIIRFAPHIAVLAAVVLTLASAFKKASDEARRLETGQSLVGQMGQGVGITAQEFTNLATAMEKAGIKADEVRGKLTQLTADGLNPEQMQAYIETAKAVAEVTGVEMAEALDQVREHFQGGMEDIIALDAETNAYTDSELDLIQALYDQGRADEARAAALAIYQGKMQAVADAQNGPWKTAVEQLGQAWGNFTSWLSNTAPIENARRNLASLGQTAAYVGAIMNQITSGKGIDLNAAAKLAAGAGASSVTVKLPPARPAADPNRRTAGGRKLLGEADRELRQTTATTRAQREALIVEEARNDAAREGLSDRESALLVAKRTANFNAEEDKKDAKRAAAAGKRADAAARKREAAAKRAARAAEAEQNRIENMEEGLVRTLESLDAKVAKQSTESLETRLSAIDTEYQKLFRSIDEYSAKTAGKGMIGDRTITQARAHVEAQKAALKNYETMEFYEKRIADIEKQRAEKLDTIADRVARGLISPTQGLTESKAVIDDMAAKTADMARAGLAFAISIRGAKPDPALEALIAKFENALQNNSGGQNTRAYNEVFTAQVEAAEGRLNQLITQRNQLIELENLKVEMGLQTRRQAQQNIMAHYAATRPLILQHIDQIEALAAAYAGQLTPQMKAYFDALRARVAATKIEAAGIDATFTQMKSSIDQLLTSNIVGFIDQVAQAFGSLIAGKSDVLGFFASIGVAFLDMIAKTLQGIAMLIIQMLVLDAIEKITGIPVKALLKLYGGASVFHDGGIAGQGNRKRQVSPLAFANAPRYHDGGIAGIAPNETAAILKKGEEVLKETDPRHRFNGGGGQAEGGVPKSLRAVLAVGDDEIARAMVGPAGERVFFYHLKRNKASARQILDL
jgi:hypothetical protein